MNRSAAAIAAAFTLALGSWQPALAQAPTPVQADQQSVMSELQAWLGEVMAWSRPYNESLGRNAQILGVLDQGIVEAFEHYEAGDKKAGRTWAEAWTRSVRAEFAGFRAEVGALQRTPPAPPPSLSGDPRMAEMTRRLAEMPGRMTAYLDRSEQLANQIIALAERTARGDEDAFLDLQQAVFTLNIATLESENEVLTSSKAMVFTENHPQAQVLNASIAANLAMIAVLEAQRELVHGAPFDKSAFAARVRQHAAQIEAAAEAMERDARTTSERMRNTREMQGTALLATIERAMASYAESAQVERAIAAGCRDIAARADREDALDFDELLSAMEALAPLFEKRAALDQARRNQFET